MIRNNNFYKGQDILNDSYKDRMFNYFNPYEYNFDYNKNIVNYDKELLKSKSHFDRKRLKK